MAASHIEELIVALERPEHDPAVLRQTVSTLRAQLAEHRAQAERVGQLQDRLALALDAAEIGTWDWDLVTGRLTWDERHVRMFGLEPGQFEGTYEGLERRIHPDDRAAVAARIGQAVAHRRAYESEFRAVRPDGTVRWMHGKGRCYYDAEGRAVRMAGAVVDVTERVRAAEVSESEQRYRALFERNPDGIFTVDAAGRFVMVNPACEKATGYKAGELLGMRFTDLVAPDCLEKTVDFFGRHLTGDPANFETAVLHRGGRRVELLVTGGPVTVGGRVTAVHCAAKEITEWKRAEEALRAGERRLRLALEYGRMGTWDWAVGTEAAEWSDGHYRLLGYRVGEVPATRESLRARVHPEDVVRQERAMRESMERRADYACEFRVVWPDGSVHWLDARGRYVYDEAGRAARMYGVLTDADERKRAEAELRKAKEAAERASRAKDHFLAVLSHELRTPLTPVLAAVEMMAADASLPPGLRGPVEMIHRNVELESRLIDDLLDVTRIARDKVVLDLTTVDVHEKVRQVIDMCRAGIAERHLRVTADLTAARHHVRADAARLQQVIWNLLSNAVKFSPVGARIRVATADRPGDSLAIEVADEGVGIQPELLSRVFDAFEQGGEEVTRRFGGLGLGLAIVRALVRMHGGTVSAASDGPGRGARFVVELPTCEAAGPTGETTAAPAAATTAVARAPKTFGRGHHVLLVEDNVDTASTMARLLRGWGFRVTVAHTLASADQAAGREAFDLLVSDIGLPDGSGLDLMRRLAANSRIRGIALSGYGTEEDVRKCREAGFVAHVLKPVSVAHLRETIRQAVTPPAAG